ncbi:hypothetical protein B0O99DRAFT_597528 [Bisporella sp. PMI_857]|nr:hypothetical protein B0O99DRAFT_597528 [Bisporella sp. PMI_857]
MSSQKLGQNFLGPFPGSPAKSQGYFRFLDLPLEIRKIIYRHVFQDINSRARSTQSFGPQYPPPFYAADNYPMELSVSTQLQLLQTCHSIYQEARYEMIRTNRFVILTVAGIDIEESMRLIFTQKGIRIAEQQSASRSSNCVLQYDICLIEEDGEEDGRENNLKSFVILHSDLAQICSGITDSNPYIRRYNQHTITLTYPDGISLESSAPYFFNRKFQEELMAPFREQLWGVSNLVITGAIDEDLLQSVRNEVTRDIFDKQTTIIQYLNDLQAKGDMYFGKAEYSDAESQYQRGLLRMGTIYREITKAVGTGGPISEVIGRDFSNKLIKLNYAMGAQYAELYLIKIRQHLRDGSSSARVFSSRLIGILSRVQLADLLVTNSSIFPSAEQKARLAYLNAVGHRVLADPRLALIAIETAVELAPGNTEYIDELNVIQRML